MGWSLSLPVLILCGRAARLFVQSCGLTQDWRFCSIFVTYRRNNNEADKMKTCDI
jgi:hypothetical protein